VAGGGFSAGRRFNLINMSRPLDYTDADHTADDYWEVESNAAGVGTKITGYAICMKERKLRYASAIAPDSSDGNRTLSIDCPGETMPIGGGGSIGHSDSFLSSLYRAGHADGQRLPDPTLLHRHPRPGDSLPAGFLVPPVRRTSCPTTAGRSAPPTPRRSR